MKNFLKQKNKGGFTLIEVLVALSIFTISVLAVMATISQGISDTNFAKKKMTATYLAQEGVEYIRNLRDTYMLYDSSGSTQGWVNFYTKLTSGGSRPRCDGLHGCYFNNSLINYADNSMPITDPSAAAGLPFAYCQFSYPISSIHCPGGDLLYNSLTGKYGYSGTVSGFNRMVRLVPIDPNNEVIIYVQVSWMQGSTFRSVTLSENLYNWIEQ